MVSQKKKICGRNVIENIVLNKNMFFNIKIDIFCKNYFFFQKLLYFGFRKTMRIFEIVIFL